MTKNCLINYPSALLLPPFSALPPRFMVASPDGCDGL
jgi:hypothetical protein